MRIQSLFVLGVVCSAITVTGFFSNVASAADLKVAYVDLQQALEKSKAGAEARKDYEKEVKASQSTLDKKKEAFAKKRKAFENQRESLSEEALSSKKEELIELEKDLKRSFQDIEAKLRRKNGQIVSELVKEIREVVSEVGKAKGFTVILEKRSDAVLYADGSLDITDAVVEAFDKQ